MDEKVIKWLKDHEAMCIRIIRWILFGVVASILPFLFMLSQLSLSGLVAADLDSLLDLLLISIAVSANAINLLWDNEKKVSVILKILGIIILILIILYYTYTYGGLFAQTIRNNKMLAEYNKLTDSLEKANFTDSYDYENITQQLTNIKSLIDEEAPKPDKLKRLRFYSVASLVATTILGVVVEYRDDRNQRKKGTGPEEGNNPNPPKNDFEEAPPY